MSKLTLNMKTALRISVLLNLAFLGGLILFLANPRKEPTALVPASPPANPPAQRVIVRATPQVPHVVSAPFHWSQLASTRDYRAYVANLRAIGCPELTIEDIVRGDADRAFSWERNQLGLDGSGNGPWSRTRERQLVASLLSGQPTTVEATTLAHNPENSSLANDAQSEPAQSMPPAQGVVNRVAGGASSEVAQTSAPAVGATTATPAYPLFLQNVNWSVLGFNADQQAAIAQVRQQFKNVVNAQNQNFSGTGSQSPTDSKALTRWQAALQTADNQLRDLLGAQAYMAYEQQQYYAWYQPQVLAANAKGEPLFINPDAFSVK